VIDLRKKFNIKATEERPKRIIVCKTKKFIVGLLVDNVSEIIALSKENIKPTPGVVLMQIQAGLLSGVARIGERIIAVLNLENILTREETTKLSEIGQ